jgi:hypothetical protein
MSDRLLAEKVQEIRHARSENSSRRYRYIEISDKMHRGVTITIGDQQYYTNKTVQNVKIYRKGSEIMVENLGEPACD